MGEEEARQNYQHLNLKEIYTNEALLDKNRVIMEDGDESCDSISIESSLQDSTNSLASSYSSDLVEDASSSTLYSSSSSSSNLSLSNGPLYKLSELMDQLPLKRGLSKYYQGKSQSFTSLASVESIEDLAKKGTPYRIKMKSCKSYGGGLDGHKSYSPKATISKKASRGSFLSSLGKRSTFVGGSRPCTPVQRNY